MQNCPPRSLPQALGGGPAGGARLRVSDAPAFDIRSVTAGVRRVHHPRPEVRLLAQRNSYFLEMFVLWSGVGLASPGLCFEFRVRRRIRLAGSRLRSQTKPSSVVTAAQISGRRFPDGRPVFAMGSGAARWHFPSRRRSHDRRRVHGPTACRVRSRSQRWLSLFRHATQSSSSGRRRPLRAA